MNAASALASPPASARAGAAPARAPAAEALAFLAELSQALAVSLELRRTVAESVHRVVDFMQVEAAALFLLDDPLGAPLADRMLECKLCIGPVDLAGVRLAVGHGAAGMAVADNATRVVCDVAEDASIWHAAGDRFIAHSLVCVPLRTAAGPIGALEIVNRRDGEPLSTLDAELLDAIAVPIALAISNARQAQALLEQQRLKREFDLARRLQKSLLPRRRRDAFPIVGLNRPAHEISGDFYDYFELADGRIGFVVGDVSGKGLDAALLMVRAASLLRWAGKDGLAPAAWLARANDELCETTQDGRFVCALVGYCDRGARHVRLAGAGFPPVLVRRAGAFSDYPSEGPPLGILRGVAFGEHAIDLRGGTLFAFSDGATDVRDAGGRPIGHAGVRALIARHATGSAETRLRHLFSELRRMRLVDDTTVLMIEAPRAETSDVLLDFRMHAAAEELRHLRAALRGALETHGVETGLRQRLVLAVDEACSNIIRHAYGTRCSGDIALRVSREGAWLNFELTDAAPCVDPDTIKPQPFDDCRCGGLGVALIDHVMDDWRIEPMREGRGNRLLLRKRLEEANES